MRTWKVGLEYLEALERLESDGPLERPPTTKGAASRPRAESTGIARAVDSSLERREVKPVTVVLVVSVVPRCHST